MNLKIEYENIENITPYEKNAKMHPKKQIEQIIKSIEEFGMNDPIAIWGKDNIIVEGHGRLEACRQLGIYEIPIIRLDHLTEEQRKAYTLVHNKLTMNSDFDFDILNAELESILNIDMGDFGFELDMDDPDEVKEDDYDLTIKEEPISKLGDIYQLGKNRLMCGDSTKEEDVNKLMNGKFADLVVTDPPYNVAIENSKGMTIKNDNMESIEFLEFLTKAFNCLNISLKKGGAFYVWFASREHLNFENALNNNNLKVRQELIWNKNTLIIGRQDYQWKHEPCFYGWKDGASHYFIDDRTQTTVIEDKKPNISKMKKDEMQKLLEDIFSDKMSTTIINENKPSVSDLHPTMKPVKLLARLIKNSSKPDEVVVDIFGGSGSTLIACEQLHRICYTMELDPNYVDIIIQRWEKLTGQKAVLLNKKQEVD